MNSKLALELRKDVTQTQQKPESPTVTLTWHACKYKVHKLYQRYIPWWYIEDVPVVEFMYLVFTRKPGESYRSRLRSLLLYLCYVLRALIYSLECYNCRIGLSFIFFLGGEERGGWGGGVAGGNLIMNAYDSRCLQALLLQVLLYVHRNHQAH